MSKVYVIGDLHFGHKKLEELRGISTDEQVDRWNSVVTKKDVVYVLGDVFKLDAVPRLLGIKKLILGNHDRYPIPRYLQHFVSVAAMKGYNGCLLTHIPIHPNQLNRYRKNIHGHMHKGCVTIPIVFPPMEEGGEVTWEYEPDKRYVCVSSEQVNHTPVLLNPLCL